MARLYCQSLGEDQQARLVSGFQKEESSPGVLAETSEPYRPTVLVGTMSAMSDGLQLTAANHVIIMEPNSKPTVVMQAFSRAWRRGQTKTVNVYYLKCTGELGVRAETVVMNRSDIRKALTGKVTGSSGDEGVIDIDSDKDKEL